MGSKSTDLWIWCWTRVKGGVGGVGGTGAGQEVGQVGQAGQMRKRGIPIYDYIVFDDKSPYIFSASKYQTAHFLDRNFFVASPRNFSGGTRSLIRNGNVRSSRVCREVSRLDLPFEKSSRGRPQAEDCCYAFGPARFDGMIVKENWRGVETRRCGQLSSG
jgi:hypothetical protein